MEPIDDTADVASNPDVGRETPRVLASSGEPAWKSPSDPSLLSPSPPPGARAALSEAAVRRRQRFLRVRRGQALRALLLCAPVLAFVTVDMARRGVAVLFGWRPSHGFAYVGFSLLSALFWGGLLAASARRRGALRHLTALAFVVAYAWLFGAQEAFWTRFHAFQSRDSMEHVDSLFAALTGGLRVSQLVTHVGLFALVGVGCVAAARRWARVGVRGTRLGLAASTVAAVVACVVPVSFREFQSTTADILYLNGLLVRRKVLKDPERHVFLQHRRPLALPALVPAQAARRNVLLVLQESQRFDSTCVAYDPACSRATRATNSLLPERIPLLQARALGSSTLVSMETIYLGLLPTSSVERVHAAPMLWDYAKAAGFHTAYFSTQHFLFANMHLWVDSFEGPLVVATHVDPCSNMWCGPPDAQLAERVESELDQLPEPFLAIVHSANIHEPRVIEEAGSPFQPNKRDSDNPIEQRNFYDSAVHLSDRAMARIVEKLRSTEKGRRTVIVYTSDHGEALGEHAQGCHHGCSLFDEEMRVPLFFDAPAGTLAEPEERNLRSLRDVPVTHADLLPTLLDLLGLWDLELIGTPRSWMVGHPLTRSVRTTAPLPASNVSWTWVYSPASWGVLQGSRKLHARTKGGYECHDFLKDPAEATPLKRCAGLEAAAKAAFGGLLPGKFRGLRLHPEWGEHEP